MIASRKKKYNLAVIFAVLLTLIVSSAALFPLVSAHAYDGESYGDNLNVSSKTVTSYYMIVPLNTVGVMRMDGPVMGLYKPKAFKRRTITMTALIIFKDVKTDEGRNIFISTNIKVDCPSVFGAKFYFENDPEGEKVNIRESYYNGIKKALGGRTSVSVEIVLMNNSKAVTMTKAGVNKNKRVYTLSGVEFLEPVEQDPSVNDPNSPNFEWGDNGGSTVTKTAVSLFARIKLAFERVFGGGADVLDYIIVVIVLLLGVSVAGLIIKILRFALG